MNSYLEYTQMINWNLE